MSTRNARRLASLLALWLLLLPLSLARAEDTRNPSYTPRHAAMAADTSIQVGGAAQNGEVVLFTSLAEFGTGQGQGTFTVQVENTSSTQILLFYLVPRGDSTSASILTTPSNGTASEVIELPAGELTMPVYGAFSAIKWQAKTAASSGKVYLSW